MHWSTDLKKSKIGGEGAKEGSSESPVHIYNSKNKQPPQEKKLEPNCQRTLKQV